MKILPGKKRKTLGAFEWVAVPSLGIKKALAKVDTGAFSGAIHATGIRVVRKGEERKRTLKFTPLGDKSLSAETEDFMETYIRSSTGHRVKRYIVPVEIAVGGRNYSTLMGLSDRSALKAPVLLGRRFLRENGITVDVRINQELDDDGEATK